MAKPFFPWMGNKEKLVPYIHQLIPPHVKQFTEVFGGSGAVILGLQPKKGRLDIYNDLNDDLFNVFCCVKEKSFSLAKELKFLPVHGRTPFAFYRDMAAHEPDFYRHIEEEKRVVAESTCFTEEEIRELLTILDGNAKLFDVRRAAAFLFTTYGSFSGTGNSVGIKTVDPQAIVDKLPQVSRRMDSIFLEHQDALVLIPKEDRPDGIIYADPPYMLTEKVYDVRFLPEHHIILHDRASSCKGYVIISYGYDDRIIDLYKDDFFIISLKRTNPLSQTEGSTFRELIITNYDPSPYLNTIELLQGRIQKLEEALASDQVNDSRILKLQQIIADRASKKMEYDDTIVHQMIECVKVYPDGRLDIIFGGGYLIEERPEKES